MHTYDTGLAKPQRTLVCEKLVEKLAPLKKTAVPAMYIADLGIKVLPRMLRGEGDEKGFSMLANAFNGQAPAIAIAVGRLQGEGSGTDSTEAQGDLDLALYVASTNQRGLVEGRLLGDIVASMSNAQDPGIFTMLEHARQLVMGQSLGLAGVGVLRFRDEDEVGTFDDYTVWEQRYTVELDLTVNPFRAVTKMLLEIETRNKLDGIPDGHALDPLITTITTIPPPES